MKTIRDAYMEVSEQVARALNTKDPLAREGLAVVPKDIAGAGFEPATFGL